MRPHLEVELLPNARLAIRQQAQYYIRESGKELAARWRLAVNAAAQELTRSAEGGSSLVLNDDQLTGLRRWPVPGFPNHSLIYRYEEDRLTILLVDVVHGARDLPRLLSQRLRETE